MRFLRTWLNTSRASNETRPARGAGWRKAQVAIACLLCLSPLAAGDRALAQTSTVTAPEGRDTIRRVPGMLMFDYNRIDLTNGGDFDLLSVHYLLRATDWLYYGIGAFAPIAQGNYGGFYGADATLHAQRNVYGNWFVNAGMSVGVGAGGSSVNNIRQFSGEGLYGRAYVGFGYQARTFSFGVNYARVAILGSQINDTAINFFVQRPLSLSVGDYSDAGRYLGAQDPRAPEQENIISIGATHVSQINPTGSYTGDFGLISTQFTHFLNRDVYSFFAVDLGYSGLLWYNQAHGGFGRRFALSRNLNLYGQIGLGSSGWVTDTVDTGPGFFVYPKVTLEYLFRNGVGATLSAGYMYAPMGTSQNWTVGLGLNYHLSQSRDEAGRSASGMDYTMRGFRVNVFGRRTSEIYYNGRYSDPLNMIAVQVDYAINDNLYAAGQLAIATNRFRGFAGYAEGFIGLGYQRNLTRSGRLQGYAQFLYGGNDVGVDARREVGALLYPSIGFNYNMNDRFSMYGQVGATISTGSSVGGGPTNRFENYSLGFGMNYRFSLPFRS